MINFSIHSYLEMTTNIHLLKREIAKDLGLIKVSLGKYKCNEGDLDLAREAWALGWKGLLGKIELEEVMHRIKSNRRIITENMKGRGRILCR